jgi:SNF family Na+-dependent transporter
MKKDYYKEILYCLLITMLAYVIGVTLGIEKIDKYFVIIVSWISIIFLVLEMFIKDKRK